MRLCYENCKVCGKETIESSSFMGVSHCSNHKPETLEYRHYGRSLVESLQDKVESLTKSKEKSE